MHGTIGSRRKANVVGSQKEPDERAQLFRYNDYSMWVQTLVIIFLIWNAVVRASSVIHGAGLVNNTRRKRRNICYMVSVLQAWAYRYILQIAHNVYFPVAVVHPSDWTTCRVCRTTSS